MKLCKKCGEQKRFDEFHVNKAKKDGRQTYCKICSVMMAKEDYKSQGRKEIFIIRAKEKRKECREIADIVKRENGCFFCGESEACCLDFHHKGDDKDKGVSYWTHAKSKTKMLEEIKKCSVVCSNCHRKIHAGLLEDDKLPLCSIKMGS
jgi:hypothetical protein